MSQRARNTSSPRPTRSWPPEALKVLLRSKDWELSPIRAGLPRHCQDRWNFLHDHCKSTTNGPRLRVCAPSTGTADRLGGLYPTKTGKKWCDEYSVGSGYCAVLPASRTMFYRNHNASRVLVEAGHCFTRLLTAPNMFLCPLRAPVALASMRKAGSNTIGPWLYALDGNSRPAMLSELWFSASERAEKDGSPTAFKSFMEWLFGPRGLAHSNSLHREQREEVVARLQYEFTGDARTSKLMVPPGWCIPCCASASGRLPVLLVRNPFRRLASYFRHKFVHNEQKSPLHTWAMFPAFLRRLASYRRASANRTGRESFYGFAPPAPLGPNDVTHTLSLAELVRDPRWPADARRALQSRLFPLRLEVISSDLVRLRAVLCAAFQACGRLPAMPDVVPLGVRRVPSDSAPRWIDLWTEDALRLVHDMYASDFRHLGYSKDPLVEAPVRKPLTCWARGAGCWA